MTRGTMTRSSPAQTTCRFINDRLRPMADPFLSWLAELDGSPSRLPRLVPILSESTDRARCWRRRATEQPGIRLRFRFKKETCGITISGENLSSSSSRRIPSLIFWSMRKLSHAFGALGITLHRKEGLSSTYSHLRRECWRVTETRSIGWANTTIRMGKAQLS